MKTSYSSDGVFRALGDRRLTNQEISDRLNEAEDLRYRLVIALQALTGFCEHANGETPEDNQRLFAGMSLGIDLLSQIKDQIPGFQRQTYWDAVRTLQQRYLDHYADLLEEPVQETQETT